MIRVNRWNGLSIGNRDIWTEDYVPGRTVAEIAGPGFYWLNQQPVEGDVVPLDHDHITVTSAPGDGGLVTTLLYQALISYAVSTAVQLLLPTPQGAKERNDERSPTHGFSRVSNVRVQGQPIPVLYGEHLTGGTVINEFTEVNNVTGSSDYLALVCVSQGPIESIAGESVDTPRGTPLNTLEETAPNSVRLNDNSLANFSGVEMWARLGTTQQDIIPGFERAKTTAVIDATLRQQTVDASGLIPHLLNYNSAVTDREWNEWGFGWDSPDTIDGAEVVLNFPQGLYRIDSDTGDIRTTPWRLGLRFCRLDGNGNPILGPGTGGNLNDGWVRFPWIDFELDRQSPFQLSFPVSLYDPLDFLPEAQGQAVLPNGSSVDWSDSNGSYLRTEQVVDADRRPSDWPNTGNGTCEQFTFEGWFAFKPGGPFTDPGVNRVTLYEWTSDGSDGIHIGFRTHNNVWQPYVEVGKFNRFAVFPSHQILPSTDPENPIWYHIAVSHRRLGSQNNETTVYINGVPNGTWSDNHDIITPTGDQPNSGSDARMTVGWSGPDILTPFVQAESYRVYAWYDEIVVWATTLSAQAVRQRYNDGRGQQANGSNPDVVLLWRFDGDSYDDFSSYGNHAESVGSMSFEDGRLIKFLSPDTSRGRYRIQAMRINGEALNTETDRIQDQGDWQLAISWLDEAFSYPSAAYYGIHVPGTEQLNTSAPNVTALVRGRKVKIWDGVNSSSPNFREEWTQNPAWIAADVATDPTYGGGHVFSEQDVDWDTVKEFADYCDTQVPDGRGSRSFYRQEYEQSGNKVLSPEDFGSAFWNTGSATIIQNTAESPRGDITADKITDDSASTAYFQGATFAGNTEPTWVCFSLFVKKDPSYTGASVEIFQVVGGLQRQSIFNIDDGSVVQRCQVVDYDDEWWLVNCTPIFSPGGSSVANTDLRIYPARHPYGQPLVVDETLQGSIEVWGAFMHRGRSHLDYLTDGEGSRAYLYMASEDSDGLAQVIPDHWVKGYSLRLSGCADPGWDTPESALKGLVIQDVRAVDNADGYNRTWQISCLWPEGVTRPASSFPNLVRDGRDWSDVATYWQAGSGDTLSSVFDNGSNGPETINPRYSTVLRGVSNGESGVVASQDLTVAPGGRYNMRLLGAFADQGSGRAFTPQIQNNGSVVRDQSFGEDYDQWKSASVEVGAVTSTISIELYVATDTPVTFYVDGVSCWLSADTSGRRPGGTVGGSEALHHYDAVHDFFKDIWETLIDICLTARAFPVREGKRLRFKVDKKRDPIGLVTLASTVVGGESSTFRVTYTNPRARTNSITIDFHDRQELWERATVQQDAAELETTADAGLVRSEDIFLLGVTRRSQAVRHAKYVLGQHSLLTHQGAFQTGPGALSFEPGDVVEIAHDLMPWGQSGRCARDSGTGLNRITFDPEDFSAWTYSSSSLRITPDAMSDDLGLPTADLLENLVDEQAPLYKTITEIVNLRQYVFSFKAKKLVGTKLGIRVFQSGGDDVIAEYTWATGSFDQVSGPSGTNLLLDDLGDGWVRLSVEIWASNTNNMVAYIIPERFDFLGARVFVAAAQFEIGTDTPTPYERPGKGIWLDRHVLLRGGDEYTARVTSNASGETGTCSVLSGPGDYQVGDLLEVDVDELGFVPHEGDEYILHTEVERFTAQIVSMGINQSGSVDVEWLEYDDGVYGGDELQDELPLSRIPGLAGGSGSRSPRRSAQVSRRIPGPVTRAAAIELPVSGPAGDMATRLEVSWGPPEDEAGGIREFRIYIAYVGSGGSVGTLRHVATVNPGTFSAVVPLPSARAGQVVRIAVQAVSTDGSKLSPEDCAGTTVVLGARATAPLAPENFMAHMEGDQIVFTWDHVTPNDGVVYEIRHGSTQNRWGGWNLAQVVGESRDNRMGPTDWWATASNAGATGVEYMIRARNSQGVYSPVAVIGYGARVHSAEVLTSSNYWFPEITEAWHSYGDGWVTDSSPASHEPVLGDMSRHSDGYLTMDSGKLTGTFTTSSVAAGLGPQHFEREEPLRLEGVIYAISRNPTEVGVGRLNTRGETRYSVANPVDQVGYPFRGNTEAEAGLQGEVPTLRLQIRLIIDSPTAGESPKESEAVNSVGQQGWIDYRPGIYQCHGAQWRVVITRPSADWDVRIYRFWTQAQRALPDRHYRSPFEHLQARKLDIG